MTTSTHAPGVFTKAKQVSIHVSEKDVYRGQPLYEAIVNRFNAEGFAGVTVYKALEGFGGHHHVHRGSLLGLHLEAPMLLIMVDTEPQVRKACAILDGMLIHGAVVLNDVEVAFYGRADRGAHVGKPVEEGLP